MATLVGAKKVGPEFGKSMELVSVIYDFAADGGEVENNIVLTAQGKCVVKLHHINVITSVTSGGAVEVSLGKGAAGQAIQNANLICGLAEISGLALDGIGA
jgi:N-acetyl-gamma-glutamylphosphate reductase